MTLFPNPSGPYETAAETYRDNDMAPIALPERAKAEPVAGWTGRKHRGVYAVTDSELRFHAGMRRRGNIGVRLPEDVIGLDIDVRHAGDTTVALTENRLGVPLPDTLSSTSRDDGSRIAFYRVPPGLSWKDLGGGVELVWWGHRYAVAWPSVHPDTGETYGWYDAEGAALPGVPDEGWAPAADLPAEWVAELTKDAVRASEPDSDLPTLRPDVVRARVRGTLGWLGRAKDGERNKRIFEAACLLGGLASRLPDDCHEDDLTDEALQDAVREAFAGLGVPADEPKANDTLQRGFEAGARDPAGDEEWDGGVGKATDDFTVEPEARAKVRLDVTNEDDAYKAACKVLGTRSLSGVFRRDGSLVHTPRIGEDGYVELTDRSRPEHTWDDDGPAQVQRLDVPGLRAFVAHSADVFKMVTPQGQRGKEARAALLPNEVAKMLLGAPRYVAGARRLRTVVHTPLVLADGTVLGAPGYHDGTGVLHLPELTVPVPEGDVTREQVAEAVALIDLMLGLQDDPSDGFPFETADDRVTFVAALVTPLLQQIAPPPYPLFAIGAPTPGSGKSYLAWILREVHGGVFRAEMPRADEELRKQITSILDQTTGRVITFDNLSGTFASARFDGLLTSREWTDRQLGATVDLTLTNDRVWTVTGNNLRFGGDMRRRVRWVTIDSKMARPETRTGFKIDLKPWVRAHRGELLGALLTLVVGWCQAGRPMPEADRSDDFTLWTQVTQGLLAWAGIPGVVGGSERAGGLEDAEDADVLDVLCDVFGVGKRWTAGDAIRHAEFETPLADVLPRPVHGGRPNEKTLGRWLSRWQDRPTESGLILRKRNRQWWLEWDLL